MHVGKLLGLYSRRLKVLFTHTCKAESWPGLNCKASSLHIIGSISPDLLHVMKCT